MKCRDCRYFEAKSYTSYWCKGEKEDFSKGITWGYCGKIVHAGCKSSSKFEGIQMMNEYDKQGNIIKQYPFSEYGSDKAYTSDGSDYSSSLNVSSEFGCVEYVNKDGLPC